MKIVAFLQNQYFFDPPRMIKMYEKWKVKFPDDYREKWIRTWLFYSCLSGKRLRKVFGEELCDHIIWDEVSPEIGGKASSAFKPDPTHMQEVLDKHKPKIILAFGKKAEYGMKYIEIDPTMKIFIGPHPTARGKILPALNKMNSDLVCYLATEKSDLLSFLGERNVKTEKE